MNFKEITELLKLVNKLELSEFKMRDGELEISIRTKHYEKIRKEITPVPASGSILPVQQVQAAPPAPVAAATQAPQPAESSSEAPEKEKPAEESSKNYLEIRSPIVGTFYRSSSPDKPPYVKVGDTIEVGTVVCIVEAMKLFNEIESDVGGKIVKVMVEDASPVEYDQVLYLVDPNP
jgi:acetyl-CoA carboxylase biotin carboxyl carrier protein